MSDPVQIIEKRLSAILGVSKCEKFKEYMEKSGFIISGSFVLQAILNVEWENSDIDVFCTGDSARGKTPGGYLSSMFEDFLFDEKLFGQCENYEHVVYDDHYGDCFSNGNFIQHIRKYTISFQTFETIILDCDKENLKDYVCNNFDFDIVKNICYVKNNKFVIDIMYPECIANKTFEFKYQKDVMKSIERADKYISRGFTITFNGKPYNREAVINSLSASLDINKYIENNFENMKPTRLYIYHTNKSLDNYNNRAYYTIKPFDEQRNKENFIDIMLDDISGVETKYNCKSGLKCKSNCSFKDKSHTHLIFDTGHFNFGAYTEIVVTG
jgi:hypothetical protein